MDVLICVFNEIKILLSNSSVFGSTAAADFVSS